MKAPRDSTPGLSAFRLDSQQAARPTRPNRHTRIEHLRVPAEAKFYEIDFLRSFFETRPRAAQTIRGCVLGECDVGLLRFWGPLGASSSPRDHTATRAHITNHTQARRGLPLTLTRHKETDGPAEKYKGRRALGVHVRLRRRERSTIDDQRQWDTPPN